MKRNGFATIRFGAVQLGIILAAVGTGMVIGPLDLPPVQVFFLGALGIILLSLEALASFWALAALGTIVAIGVVLFLTRNRRKGTGRG